MRNLTGLGCASQRVEDAQVVGKALRWFDQRTKVVSRRDACLHPWRQASPPSIIGKIPVCDGHFRADSGQRESVYSLEREQRDAQVPPDIPVPRRRQDLVPSAGQSVPGVSCGGHDFPCSRHLPLLFHSVLQFSHLCVGKIRPTQGATFWYNIAPAR